MPCFFLCIDGDVDVYPVHVGVDLPYPTVLGCEPKRQIWHSLAILARRYSQRLGGGGIGSELRAA